MQNSAKLHNKFQFLISLFTTSFIFSFNNSKAGVIGNEHFLMKDVGLWMKENLSQNERAIIPESFSAYYFYENNPNNFSGMIYAKDVNTLVRYMKFKNSKYLQIHNWHACDNLAVDYLFKNKETADLQLLKSFKKDDIEIRVYQLR